MEKMGGMKKLHAATLAIFKDHVGIYAMMLNANIIKNLLALTAFKYKMRLFFTT
jgi:uridylate kinase